MACRQIVCSSRMVLVLVMVLAPVVVVLVQLRNRTEMAQAVVKPVFETHRYDGTSNGHNDIANTRSPLQHDKHYRSATPQGVRHENPNPEL